MEPMNAMQTAAALFGMGAVGGLLMAGIRLKGDPRPPSWIAMLHGVLAAAGLTLLVYAACTVDIPALAQVSMLVLLAAALVGAWLNLRFHAQMLPLPLKGIAAHALIAIAGLGLLLIVVIRA